MPVDDGDVFTSGLITVETPRIYISQRAKNLVNSLQKKLPGLEWALLFKGRWSQGMFCVSDDYVCPEQDVSAGAVDFTNTREVNQLIGQGYNTFMHSHPMNMKSFSSSDKETLTTNMECSILYCQGEFCTADLRVKAAPATYVVLHPDVVVFAGPEEPVPAEIMARIKPKTYTHQFGHGAFGGDIRSRVADLGFPGTDIIDAEEAFIQETLENVQKYQNEFETGEGDDFVGEVSSRSRRNLHHHCSEETEKTREFIQGAYFG